MAGQTLILKLCDNLYVFDEWRKEPIYYHGREAWIRWLLTINDQPIIKHRFGPHLDPRLEIKATATQKRELFFSLEQIEASVTLQFHRLTDVIYPYPGLYTPPGDFDAAMKHCDRCVKTITNLIVFL